MKTKSFFSLVLILFIGFNTFSQTYVTQIKEMGGDFWGYVDLNGEIIIPAKYPKCYQFSEDGYAPYYNATKKQYYFLNLKGEILTTEIERFKLMDGFGVKGFSDGLAPIRLGKKWGYINTEGKVAIPAKYDKISSFNGGYAVAKSEGKYTILNAQGEETQVEVSDIIDMRHFSEQLAPYRARDKKFGFIDNLGKIAVQAQFLTVGYFNGGLAWAKAINEKVGYINTKGEWHIQPQFITAKDFDIESGMARVRVGDKWGYVNKTGEVSYVTDSEICSDFSNGLAKERKNDKVGFYNANGEWAIQPQFDAVRNFKNGYAAAKLGIKWGVIDKEGNWVIEPTFAAIKDMELVK